MARGQKSFYKLYKDTRRSGDTFESSVMSMVKTYTNAVWHNVRIETLLTQSGQTEMDIVFYNGGVIYILELKRVRKIVGEYGDRTWVMYGWSSLSDDSSKYVAPNVIGQNNIHARSLMDLYHSEFVCYPTIIPVIIVPDNCEVPDGLKKDVLTVEQLERFMMEHHAPGRADVTYRLSFLLDPTVKIIRRGDFIDKGMREGASIRGRRRL